MKKRPIQIYAGLVAIGLVLVGTFALGEGKTIGWLSIAMGAFFAWGYFDDNFKKGE